MNEFVFESPPDPLTSSNHHIFYLEFPTTTTFDAMSTSLFRPLTHNGHHSHWRLIDKIGVQLEAKRHQIHASQNDVSAIKAHLRELTCTVAGCLQLSGGDRARSPGELDPIEYCRS